MILFLVLLTSTLVLRAVGAAGVNVLDSWIICLRGGLAAMFLLTALTGLLEILGALGLLLPAVATVAAACLGALLMAMFPANVRAALPLRALLQMVFIAALLIAGFG